MKRNKVKNKHKAAKKFNKGVHKTKKINLPTLNTRGGRRL